MAVEVLVVEVVVLVAVVLVVVVVVVLAVVAGGHCEEGSLAHRGSALEIAWPC